MIQFFEHIFYIFEGYSKLFWHLITHKNSYMVKKRRLICSRCPYKKHWRCSLCGCIIPAKIEVDYPITNDGLSIGGCPDDPPRW